MTINTLSLPIDIPWKRLCFSEDMIDLDVCDEKFPNRWRSSVAVFSYEPPEEHQTYEDVVISYLKVTCTITGVLGGSEVGYHDLTPWSKNPLVHTYLMNIMHDYYACYGAILEVSIKPWGNQDFSRDQYPYFADFEPKKRELYELVSESGEIMSRSLSGVKVNKGLKTTVSNEVLDTDKKSTWEFKPEAYSVSVGGSSGGGGELTTKNLNQAEHTNIMTSDQSREMRELYSHTTQLTQMYHQFTSYHLGTNRAVFFMLPRPHIVQSELTFVKGPRVLEGIQDVFLVVIRPKEVEKFCIEAYLETAHLDRIAGEEQQISKQFKAGGGTYYHGDANWMSFLLSKSGTIVNESMPAGPGWEIDTSRGSGGYEIADIKTSPETLIAPGEYNGSPIQYTIDVTVSDDKKQAQINASVGPGKLGGEGKVNVTYATLSFRIILYLRSTDPETLFLTGRGVCSCPPPIFTINEEALVGEEMIAINRGPGEMSVRTANEMREVIGRLLVKSINAPNRYPRGQMRISEAQFIARKVADLLSPPENPDNVLLAEIVGLEPEVRDKIVATMPRLRRADLLRMQLQETMDRFELTHEEAVHLRRAALGLERPPVDPKERWDPPSHRIEHEVPNVTGFSLAEATRMLKAEDLLAGEVTYQDSEQPTGIVLNQHPDGGETVRGGTEIHLVLATGLTVRIPDVVGKPLTEALCMLREAGLQSEPELEFLESREQPKHTVLDITPAPRTYVTPNARVVLQVAQA